MCIRDSIITNDLAVVSGQPITSQLVAVVGQPSGMASSLTSTQEMADLAISFVAKTRRQSDQLAKTHFKDTVVDYRDDNRQMWKFIEQGDEEEAFDEQRKVEPARSSKACRRAITM